MAGKGGKRPGAGRPKGSVNKTTAQAKEAIEAVFASLQESEDTSLEGWAKANLGDFYKLIFPKLLPVQVNHADNEGGKLTPSINVTIGAGPTSSS